jgi:hypothetical protein
MTKPRAITRAFPNSGDYCEGSLHSNPDLSISSPQDFRYSGYACSDTSSVGGSPITNSLPIYRDNLHLTYPVLNNRAPRFGKQNSLPSVHSTTGSFIHGPLETRPVRKSYQPSDSLPNSYSQRVDLLQNVHLQRPKSLDDLKSFVNNAMSSTTSANTTSVSELAPGEQNKKKTRKPRPPNAKRKQKGLDRLAKHIEKNNYENSLQKAGNIFPEDIAKLEALDPNPRLETTIDWMKLSRSGTWNHSEREPEVLKRQRTKSGDWRKINQEGEEKGEIESCLDHDKSLEKSNKERQEKVMWTSAPEWFQLSTTDRKDFMLKKRFTEPEDEKTKLMRYNS